jgi:hypothetical protein
MSRRGRARDRTWLPPGPPEPPTREVVAGAPAARPSWPRSRSPSLGQSAAVAARLGQGLPPATVEVLPTPAAAPESPAVVVADQGDGCGRSDRPLWARPLGDMAPVDPRTAGIPGWGRNRGSCW